MSPFSKRIPIFKAAGAIIGKSTVRIRGAVEGRVGGKWWADRGLLKVCNKRRKNGSGKLEKEKVGFRLRRSPFFFSGWVGE
jgi:hypothetical protein